MKDFNAEVAESSEGKRTQRLVSVLAFVVAFIAVLAIAGVVLTSRPTQTEIASRGLVEALASELKTEPCVLEDGHLATTATTVAACRILPIVPTQNVFNAAGSSFRVEPAYTKQQLKPILSHLQPNGFLGVSGWEYLWARDALRVTATLAQALKELGVEDVSGHFLIVSEGFLDRDGRRVLVLASREPISREVEKRAFEFIAAHPEIALIYAPHYRGEAAGIHPVDPNIRWNPFASLLVGNDPQGFAGKYLANVAPVTRNRPFHFFTLKLSSIFERSVFRPATDWSKEPRVVILFLVLLASLAVLVAGFVGWMPGVSRSPECIYICVGEVGLAIAAVTTTAWAVAMTGWAIAAVAVIAVVCAGLLYWRPIELGDPGLIAHLAASGLGSVLGFWMSLQFGLFAVFVSGIVLLAVSGGA